jgi:hypothetical protein
MKYLSIIFAALSFNSLYAQIEIFSETFSQGIPSNWSIIDVDGNMPNQAVAEYTSAWISLVNPENSLDSVASATSYFSSPAQANKWLITSAIDLGDNNNVLSWKSKSFDGSYPENFTIYLSTTSNDIASFTDTLSINLQESNQWTEHEINLSELNYNNQTVYIAFVLKTYDGFKLLLDDVNVSKGYPLSLNEKSKQDFSIINKNQEKITILTSLQVENIELLNSFGKQIVTTKNKEIDISKLSSGLYFVYVKTAQGNYSTEKFIKQ